MIGKPEQINPGKKRVIQKKGLTPENIKIACEKEGATEPFLPVRKVDLRVG